MDGLSTKIKQLFMRYFVEKSRGILSVYTLLLYIKVYLSIQSIQSIQCICLSSLSVGLSVYQDTDLDINIDIDVDIEIDIDI